MALVMDVLSTYLYLMQILDNVTNQLLMSNIIYVSVGLQIKYQKLMN